MVEGALIVITYFGTNVLANQLMCHLKICEDLLYLATSQNSKHGT